MSTASYVSETKVKISLRPSQKAVRRAALALALLGERNVGFSAATAVLYVLGLAVASQVRVDIGVGDQPGGGAG